MRLLPVLALPVLTLPLFTLGLPVQAQDLVTCATSMRGEAVTFAYDPEIEGLQDSLTLRQKLAGLRGEAITCPGLVTLRAFTPELTDAERAPFCLQWDRKLGTYIGYDLGDRDGFLTCRTAKKQFCQRVNSSKQTAGRWAGMTKDLAVDAGTETLLHATGVVSVKGPAAVIGEQLVGIGATAVEGVGIGAALGAVMVTAVAVGGAVYVCSDEGAAPAALEAAPEPKLRPGEVAPGSELPEGEKRITATPIPTPGAVPDEGDAEQAGAAPPVMEPPAVDGPAGDAPVTEAPPTDTPPSVQN
ncbi:hypothetical protein [Gemmobacter serpentinus]|uniref:hypothetical protein n=1 Tax=Gemmobacter serpentinus TaxID=2652247 RepID=UPI00124E0EE2|nr:hypothetical protein [Gemmobacter serpentinus]